MSGVNAFTLTEGLSIVVKASVVLCVALVAPVLLRRASAATRHLAQILALVAVLLLPAMTVVAPQWGVTRRAAPDVSAIAGMDVSGDAADVAIGSPVPARPPDLPLRLKVADSAGSSGSGSTPWPAALATLYAAGVGALILYFAVQRIRTRRFIASATIVDDPEWRRLLMSCAWRIGVRRSVRLLRSLTQNVPLAVGTRHPAIVIPAIADTWEDDRRQAVLLHELAHVARHDCLTGMLAAAACAMYWFHPGIWWVARRVLAERELACDDRVIAAGAEGRGYAGHLLDIAYTFGGRPSFALAVTMARRQQLEGRLIAALDEARNRRAPARRTCLAATAAAIALLVAVAGARATVVAQPESGSSVQAAPVTPAAPRANGADLAGVGQRINDVAGTLVRAAASMIQDLQAGLPGTWEIRPTGTAGTVHLRLVETNSSSGTNVPIAQLEGLAPAQLTGPGGPVQFRLRRDAGTFAFEGVVRSGVGAGTFTFAPDAAFPDAMAKRGFARPTATEQYQLARHDIGFAFVDELTRQGYSKPQTSELVRAGQHGIHLTYLREMGALGYRLGTLPPLITLRDHGVSPEYVRQLADLGYKGLSADEVRNARDHGITPDYVRAMRDAGYGSLRLDALINARDHGVSAEYVQALDAAGYRKLPLDQVIRARDHGASADYVRDMRQLGFTLSLDELVRARDHGVTAEYVSGMAALGYGKQPIDALIRLRDHGVTTEYVKEIKGLGYDGLSVDDLISLRDHGVTVDKIKAANARAGTRLPIDMLRSLAAGGMR